MATTPPDPCGPREVLALLDQQQAQGPAGRGF